MAYYELFVMATTVVFGDMQRLTSSEAKIDLIPRRTHMSSRRTFLKTAGAVTVGVAGATTASASTDKNATVKKYGGSHEMPTNVTLLSMQNADASETLGVKLDNDAVLDV